MGRGFVAEIKESHIEKLQAPSVNPVLQIEPLSGNFSQPIIEYINSSEFNFTNSVVEKYLKLISQIIKIDPKIQIPPLNGVF